MTRFGLGSLILVLWAGASVAETVQWQLIDTGVLTHSTRGQGIEMRIKPEPYQSGVFDSHGLPELMAGLCGHYAPYVIPYVAEKTGLKDPQFVVVRLVSGGNVSGRYVMQAYEMSGQSCGAALD